MKPKGCKLFLYEVIIPWDRVFILLMFVPIQLLAWKVFISIKFPYASIVYSPLRVEVSCIDAAEEGFSLWYSSVMLEQIVEVKQYLCTN